MRIRRVQLYLLILIPFLCLVTSPTTDESPSFQHTDLLSASPAPGPIPPLRPHSENEDGIAEENNPNDVGEWHVNLPERVEGREEVGEGDMQGSGGVVVSETGSVVVRNDGIDEQVFVPLKEWKQKKLEDIELRVRRIEEKGGVVSKGYAMRGRKKKKTSKFSGETNGVCWIATPKGMGVLTFRRDSWIYRHHGERSVIFASGEREDEFKGRAGVADMQPPTFSGSEELSNRKERTIAANLQIEDRRAKSTYENDEILSDMSSAASLAPLYGPMEKLKSKALKKYNETAEEPNQSLVGALQKGTGSPIEALMAIPMVADIMRSIKEVSYALSSSQVASIQTVQNSIGENDSKVGNESNKRNIAEKKWNRSRKHGKRNNSKDESKGYDSTGKKRGSTVRDGGAKDRPFNFASVDAGARILASSGGVVGAKNVIEGSMDKYSLAPCNGEGLGGSRWIDVELSEDIILERVETGNLEYYSSSARKIAILGASAYPPAKWNVLGVFDFAHIRTLQKFEIKDRMTTTRYLRVMFAGKQGHEFYCPISTIQVFGKSLIADWKDAFESSVKGAYNVVVRPKGKGKGRVDMQATEFITKGDTDHGSSRMYGVDGRRVVRSEECSKGNHCEAGEKRVGNHEGGGIGETIPAQREYGVSEEFAHNAKSETSETRNGEGVNADKSEAVGIVSEDSGGANPNGGRSGRPGSYGSPESESEGREEDTETMSEEDRAVFEAVRADALSAVSGNDNIFRKVTRLIRLLELNQTLTNQYIDTHLARFAKALAKAQMETVRAQEVAAITEQRIVGVMLAMEGRVQELKEAMLKRDVVMCMLVVCVSFLVGTNWVLWTAVSGVRMRGRGDTEETRSTESGITEVCRIDKPPVGKRGKKEKGGRGRGKFVVSGRSVSSMELGVVANKTKVERKEKGGIDSRRISLEGVSRGT